MTRARILQIFFLFTIHQCSANIPEYQCSTAIPTQCILKDIRVTKENFNFKPTAPNPSAITQVVISSSQIPVFGDDICNTFPNLGLLEIQAAQIQMITPSAFANCGQLTSLKIENQYIRSLDRNVFNNLRNLYNLYLNNVGLESLDVDIFDSLPQLFTLSLSGNKLYEFPVELLKNLKNVDQLYINSNELSDIDEVAILEALPKLNEFYLNDNDFNCNRIDTLVRMLKENGINGIAATVQRKRYYTPIVIEKIQCLTEQQWSSVFYAKVAQKIMKDLKEIKNAL